MSATVATGWITLPRLSARFLLEDGFRGGLKRRDTMQLIERCRQDRKNKIAVEEQLAQSCRERELDAARADWVVRVIDQDIFV